ncbi:unnamed protein product, partial [Durusdinium trenchii]
MPLLPRLGRPRCHGTAARGALGGSSIAAVDRRIFDYEKKFTLALKANSWRGALDLWAELRRSSLTPSGSCCSAAVSTLARSWRWQKALELFDGLQRECPDHVPSQTSCNAAIAALGRGAHWRGALHLVRQMEAEIAWPKPDTVSFGACCDAMARAAQWDVALKLLEESPSLPALSSCISAQERASEWHRAIGLLRWARSVHLKPNTAVMNVALGALGHGHWAQAMHLLDQMRQEGPRPTTISLNTALRACADASAWTRALSTFELFQALGLQPTNITYTTLIGALANGTLWQQAVVQLEELDHQLGSSSVDLITLHATLTACARGLAGSCAMKLLSELPSRSLQPDHTTYGIALSCLGGAWPVALQLLEHLDSPGELGWDEVIFRTAQDVFSTAPLEEALRLYRRGVDLKLVPGVNQVTDLHGLPAETALVLLSATLLEFAMRPEDEEILVIHGIHGPEKPGEAILRPLGGQGNDSVQAFREIEDGRRPVPSPVPPGERAIAPPLGEGRAKKEKTEEGTGSEQSMRAVWAPMPSLGILVTLLTFFTLRPPKVYMYGPAASPLGRSYAVDCSHWSELGSSQQADLVDEVLEVLRRNGFVVLEGMVPADEQLAMEEAAKQHFEKLPEGYFTSPLRAERSQVHVPYEDPWSKDWLVSNDLVLQVTARYVINNMACGRSEEEQQSAWCQWVMEGSSVEWFHSIPPQAGPLATDPPHGCTTVGAPEQLGPWLGRVMITKTPPQSPLMTRHRDIILPGPFAQLTIGVPLTPLDANNGPLALR